MGNTTKTRTRHVTRVFAVLVGLPLFGEETAERLKHMEAALQAADRALQIGAARGDSLEVEISALHGALGRQAQDADARPCGRISSRSAWEGVEAKSKKCIRTNIWYTAGNIYGTVRVCIKLYVYIPLSIHTKLTHTHRYIYIYIHIHTHILPKKAAICRARLASGANVH